MTIKNEVCYLQDIENITSLTRVSLVFVVGECVQTEQAEKFRRFDVFQSKVEIVHI